MPLEYPCEDFYWDWQGSCPSLHDFSSWQADVVVVNLGTNDYVYGSPIQPWLFKQTYLAFLQDIRAKYPASIIAVIEPLLLSCSEDSLLSDISDAILQAAVDMDDDRVIFYPTGTVDEPWLSCRDDYIDYTHPNIEGSIKFADKLYESMKDDICSVFPNKCGAETTSGNVPVLYCGSSSCTQQVWDTLAGRYTCGSRIEWLQKLGYSESESCTIVEDEFPTICLCAPDSSPQSNSSKAITMRPSFTPSTAPTKSPIKLQKTDNNIFVATSVPSPTLPPAQAVVDRVSCVAITQSELAPGLWATTDELCRQCEPPNPITWWPCDLSPPLCRCNPTDVISSPTPPPVVPTEPTAISCVAVNQEDLPSDSDLWATTDESCKQCEPPNPITWWPCNTELCLCT